MPSSGPARTAQGEVVWITGRIVDEVTRNGGANRDRDHRALVDALTGQLAEGESLDDADLDEAQSIANVVGTGRGGYGQVRPAQRARRPVGGQKPGGDPLGRGRLRALRRDHQRPPSSHWAGPGVRSRASSNEITTGQLASCRCRYAPQARQQAETRGEDGPVLFAIRTAAALGALLVTQPETDALLDWLDREERRLVSSDLLKTELRRMSVREGRDQAMVSALLDRVSLAAPDRATYRSAGLLPMPRLRTLDAVHLEAAIRLDVRAVLTYDHRLGEAARTVGLDVVAPGRPALRRGSAQ